MSNLQIPYLPDINWYRAWFASALGERPLTGTVLDTAPNRTLIRGAWGEQTLTVPILGGRRRLARTPWEHLLLSEHDDWRHKHWQAITSAYGSLPYFPYFKDDFAPVFNHPQMHDPESRPDSLKRLSTELHHVFLKCASLEVLSAWLRSHPQAVRLLPRQTNVPLNVCALELLFMYGPETIFYLL